MGEGEEEVKDLGEEELVEREENQDEREEKSTTGMAPWEQHSAVIAIPRYDYKAPSSLLQHSHSGFLVTCPIKREKSATKEAMSILEKCIGFSTSCNSEILESLDAVATAKRRKICIKGGQGKSVAASRGDLESEANVERLHALSLVKLTRSGLLLFTYPRNNSPEVVDIVSKIFCSLKSGSLSSPLWCHRFFPIQATCCLNEKELHTVVSKLVIQFVNDEKNKLARPVKFAVGFNRRGIEETEMKITTDALRDCSTLPLLDRNKCFAIVAAAVKDAVSDSVVDLKSPELSVLVELLPVSGMPNGSLVVAVSVLPHNLVSTKPKLSIKALASDTKARNGKKN